MLSLSNRLRVVFLNCNNLFEVGSPRGSKTAQELSEKMEHLAETIKSASVGSLPSIVCLCEVGSENLGKELVARIAPDVYHTLWSGVPSSKETGLMICYNPNFVQYVAIADDGSTRGISARCRWLATQFQLKSGSRGRFWLVVNHWKSQMGDRGISEHLRIMSAAEIGDFFLKQARFATEAMLLIGDFNCEPFSTPFHKTRNFLRAVRERTSVLREKNRLAYFYNPMWRLLGEADNHEESLQKGYSSPRPPGTYLQRNMGWRTFDQILVSKPMLTNGFVSFIESSICIAKPHERCSDHCAISVEFKY